MPILNFINVHTTFAREVIAANPVSPEAFALWCLIFDELNNIGKSCEVPDAIVRRCRDTTLDFVRDFKTYRQIALQKGAI